MDKIRNLCNKYELGNIIRELKMVTGGLMHKMYHVSTDKGDYAIKCLNPDIMNRADALQNMINSEIVSNKLINTISLVAAKNFDGNNIIELDGSYYVIFDWLEGKSIFVPDISIGHCEQVGQILGKIHMSNLEVDSIKKSNDIRKEYDWKLLLEKAQHSNEECYLLLQKNLDDIIRWDRQVVVGLQEISRNQVISHRDLDPKNIMWKDNQPYIIDWEAAGYVNPFQELIEVLNYWISDDNGKYSRAKFDAIMRAYTENVDIKNVSWDAVLDCSFDGMLGWLEYSVKRALAIEGIAESDQKEGLEQTKGTIYELKKYENQMQELKDWLNECADEMEIRNIYSFL